MKTYFKILAVATLLSGINKASFAQATDITGYQDIVTPTTIVKSIDISFNNLVIPETSSGSITISPSGSYSIAAPGNYTHSACARSVSAASFALTGKPDYIYAITLPSSCIIINKDSNCIIADKFTSSPFGGIGILNSSGIQVIKIGATFKFHSCHALGNNKSTTVAPIVVNYN